MSNLVEHAERELKLAGLFKTESDYSGRVAEGVMRVVKVFAKEGHSGSSAGITVTLLTKLLNFENLVPINSDPQYWVEVQEGCRGTNPLWQSIRNPSYFSEDGGVTFYNLDDPERKNFPKKNE